MKKIIGYIILISLVIGCIIGFYSFTGFYVWSDVAVNDKLVREENTFSIHNNGSVYADGEIINTTKDTLIINAEEIIIYCKDINTNEVFTYSNALSYTVKKQEKITIAINILKPPHYITTESEQQARYIAENYQIFKLEYKLTDGETHEIMSLEQTNSYFLPLGTIIVVPTIVCAIVVSLIISNKQAKKNKKYLKANFAKINSISEKYTEEAKKLLERFSRLNRNYFHSLDNTKYNTLITEYWNTNTLLGKLFEYDGFEKYNSKLTSYTIYSSGVTEAKLEIKSFVERLKKELPASGEWTDIKSIPYVAYFIIRNYIILSNDWHLQNLIPKGSENYKTELDIIANSATDSAEQSNLGDGAVKEQKDIWHILSITAICFGMFLIIFGVGLIFGETDSETYNQIYDKAGKVIAIVGASTMMSSLLFTLIARIKTRGKTNLPPTISSTEELNLGGGKELIVDDIDTEDDEQARRNEEAMERMREFLQHEEQERKERERAEEYEKEHIKQEKHKQSVANLNANKQRLILEYSNAVENFILKIVQKYNNVFLGLFNDTEIPLTSTLANPYKNQHNLFCDTVKRDGLDFVQSSDEAASEYLQNIIEALIKGLKKRIKENNEWEDEYTLPVLLYYIIRNNVIKHYHTLYLKEIGCLTMGAFCERHNNGDIPQANAFAYTYYYIYENDINLPFMDTYKKLCTDMQKTIAEQKQRKLESDLFGTPKAQSIFTNKIVSETLSSIEKIDRMSGKEFEIFMENFFSQKGYKVERTPLSGDYGVDLIIEHTFGRTGVQLKCYSKKVSADAVQQIVTGLRHYKLSNGMVITNNYFQKEAITLAAENHIELWDRDILIKKFKTTQ
ncbi:MAG: restriction endonuclease [Roseburia sp.]|nr:restriction endonuclease [Roseburia sp.]